MAREKLAALRRKRGYTQARLAEMLTLQRVDGARRPVATSTVAAWEQGTATPRPWWRRPLAEALEITLDDLDELLAEDTPPNDAGSVDDVDRRDLLRGSAALGVVTSVAPVLASSALLGLTPDRVSEADIADVREARNQLRGISFSRGGESIGRDGAVARLRAAADLLDAQCPTALRPDLCSAVGALANTVGFAAFDAGEHDDARTILRFALACGEEARNWGLRARTLAADLAPVELWLGRPDDALTIVEQAQVRSDRLTPTERAMTWSTRARAHAELGDVQATLAAVGRSDDELAAAAPGESPEMRWYNDAEHANATGQALGALALTTGRHASEAVDRQRAAIAGFGDAYARSRIHAQTHLATVLMATGDPAEAVSVADELLVSVAEVRSHRTSGLLAGLDLAAAQHAGRPDVDDLQQRLARAAPGPVLPDRSPAQPSAATRGEML